MSIFSPKKEKKCEKLLMSVGNFLGKLYFLTGVTLKFYQKSNFSPKNNLLSTFYKSSIFPYFDTFLTILTITITINDYPQQTIFRRKKPLLLRHTSNLKKNTVKKTYKKK